MISAASAMEVSGWMISTFRVMISLTCTMPPSSLFLLPYRCSARNRYQTKLHTGFKMEQKLCQIKSIKSSPDIEANRGLFAAATPKRGFLVDILRQGDRKRRRRV